jgi:hypothetical protein
MLAVCVGMFVSWVQPAEANAACYVAFVHGKRPGKPTVAQVNAYWNPDPATTSYSFPYWAATRNGCSTLMVRWNSSLDFVSQSQDVTNQLANFVTAKAIPANQLMIVAHSMGGLITRYILNNSLLLVNGQTVLTATKYLVTSQTPHLGTKASDSLAYEAGDGVYGDVVSTIARRFEDRNAASDAMRRVDMEYASTSGGWMNDVFRAKKIYTIEGWQTGEAAGPTEGLGSQYTWDLDKIWGGLCYKSHWMNAYQCGTVYGDGLVEMLSAYGRFSRSGTWDGTRGADGKPQHYFADNQSLAACQVAAWPWGHACKTYTRSRYFAGARVRWVQYGGDHQQGAWDLWPTETHNFSTGVAETSYLASYIGRNGHNLPL